jgi:hypothetical protein
LATEVAGGKPPKATVTERADAAVEDDPKVFILSRELSEVHLLLDNLSADPDTTIEALSTRQPPTGLNKDWIDQICEISWPPSPSDVKKSKQAALLIRTKDYLNRLARPASGMSIAFTLMVTQKDEAAQPPEEDRKPGVDIDETLWRCSLAANAFPDLTLQAKKFRDWLKFIRVFMMGWLVFTCLLSWYVAFGNSALAEYAAAQSRVAATQEIADNLDAGRVATATEDLVGSPKEGIEGGVTAPALPPEEASAAKADQGTDYCERWIWERAANGNQIKKYQTAEQHQACRNFDEAKRRLAIAEERPRGWLGLWRWLLGVGDAPGEGPAVALWLASILGTAVLPVFYGLLGAAAAVLRSLSQKIRNSTLTPRDLSLSIQQLALGAVVGACIGLFIVGDDTTLIGPVTLSGSAISFVAGFGVEAVFQALEALISRIFNLTPNGAAREVPPGT